MKIPVQGYRGLYRDENSGAIINSNSNEYVDYINLKNIKLNEKKEFENLKKELEILKNFINSTIK